MDDTRDELLIYLIFQLTKYQNHEYQNNFSTPTESIPTRRFTLKKPGSHGTPDEMQSR